jgi:hypothetical protein
VYIEKHTSVPNFLETNIHGYLLFEKLREVKYQGVVSASLVYDERPVIVYYRAVRPNMVAGVMENKSFGRAGKFYFYLTK